ncbi:alpha-E domain-containing protein [Phaeobacter gallaeciensis]|uniref:alpha-E domain-containing protein n=1 Tax=Phaeobacter gallaeciensis TaxID=60890 RepID=UPI00237F9483|nr:alpha-E domain-containing protein [Phaeobacter gallaeciensis]MDE4191864.1 alpha-E domain-containing protein [Phaeobacter gallaeciensis]MDE4200327.1 alpha-E domain-containing protein [Phaeobacter gallaeciensis]MDE4204225.1 alpha-E domain-containing protein [Phaeobacter gallaeciensis]MDE4208619.1 alpha-E domain-containing protein [Phaeobacter gallaeciensis]MDE4216734.1 alpha-E domain-containing protein [Phaeobacter gallaeciensis]
MLGKTAGGLYWMFRGLERAENTARLIEAGFRIALTRSTDPASDWRSIIVAAAQKQGFDARHLEYTSQNVSDYLLREPSNPSSVLSVIKAARDNARLVRTALTTEVWIAVNETWMVLTDLLKTPVSEADLPQTLEAIRHQSALVRGALHGTMLRNDPYNFCRLGTFIERADSTARIVNVKYHALLPSPSFVGSRLDNVQWEMILRSVSAHRSFRHAFDDDFNAASIAEFLLLDERFPRSLAFCACNITSNLAALCPTGGEESGSLKAARALQARLQHRDIGSIFEDGLHEFISQSIIHIADIGTRIEQEYRFIS